MILIKIIGPDIPRKELADQYIEEYIDTHNCYAFNDLYNKCTILALKEYRYCSVEHLSFEILDTYFIEPIPHPHRCFIVYVNLDLKEKVMQGLREMLSKSPACMDITTLNRLNNYTSYLLSGLAFNNLAPSIVLLFPNDDPVGMQNNNLLHCLIKPSSRARQPEPWDLTYILIRDFLRAYNIEHHECIVPDSELRYFKVKNLLHFAQVILAISSRTSFTPLLQARTNNTPAEQTISSVIKDEPTSKPKPPSV